jgi:hypothetical protein
MAKRPIKIDGVVNPYTMSRPSEATYEQWLAWEKNQFRYSEGPNVPDVPTYQYKVGEAVLFGALTNCRVEEILENGKILHLSFHDTGFNRGEPYDNGRKPKVVWWLEVDPVCLETETSFARPRIHTEYRQSSLDSLVHVAYSRGLIDSPEYQRGYVWKLEDKQRLIRSIFNKADIGKFVFIEDDTLKEYRLEVIDGKQRLRAILDYYEGRFEFEGKTWYQLSRADKREFFDLMVQWGTLQRSRVKKSDVLWLFLQLNSGGVPQTEEHIAKARKMYEAALAEESRG